MRSLRVMLAALVLVPMLLLSASPAAAHDGKLVLQAAGDGATGVTIRASYADGHQLETLVRLVFKATADNGQTVGPIQLNPSGEGQGFYTTGPVLTPGRWQVTVSAPAPNPAEVVVTVDARAAQTAPKPASPPIARPAGSGGSGLVWWLVGAGLLVAVAGSVVLLARTRNS